MKKKKSITCDKIAVDADGKISRYLTQFSVTILFFNGEPSKQNFRAVGSGILIKFGGRYFVATAGHVAKLLQNNLTIGFIIREGRHRFTPQVVVYDFDYNKPDGGNDHGFIEIAAHDARTMEDFSKTFVGMNKLCMDLSGLDRDAEWMYVNGYPLQLASWSSGNYDATSFGLNVKCVRPENVSLKGVPKSDSGYHIDCYQPSEGIKFSNGSRTLQEMPDLPGISGGGLWRLNCRQDIVEEWEENMITLAGIVYYGKPKASKIGGTFWGLLRAYHIKHFVALVRKHYPNLI